MADTEPSRHQRLGCQRLGPRVLPRIRPPLSRSHHRRPALRGAAVVRHRRL